eukprot:Protomagalhaensia_wolfi_Nauph_80__3251@NODE_3308_length_831_cov_108_425505_g2595_i0_p1_GENE_NODE_3308_length_831_cov_108_425505_g2595_i0NODE_3308_length_831_cov_108_425505_g2595_i0_p1_ORF_typecomplete_len118_score4_34SRP14/PF02290_15/6_3e12DUF4867/PF16161_5/0_077_NODE_3308_length_831_cov_108_425505_g2595_i0268621
MGRVKPHEFLAELTKNVRNDAPGSLWITCKRHCVGAKRSLKHSKNPDEIASACKNVVLVRAQSQTLHLSTEVEAAELRAFSQALGNIIRLTASSAKPVPPHKKRKRPRASIAPAADH